MVEITSAETWADALNQHMHETQRSPFDVLSFGYAAGQLLGIVLDAEHPDADDQRAVLVSEDGWVVRYNPQLAHWEAL